MEEQLSCSFCSGQTTITTTHFNDSLLKILYLCTHALFLLGRVSSVSSSFSSSSNLLVAAGGAVQWAGPLLYAGTTEGDKVFGRRDDLRRPWGIRQTVEDGGQRCQASVLLIFLLELVLFRGVVLQPPCKQVLKEDKLKPSTSPS